MRKSIALVLACAICMTSAVTAFAASNEYDLPLDSSVHIYDEDGELISTASVSGSRATGDVKEFDKTLYISVEDLVGGAGGWDVSQMVDKDYATFSSKKTEGSSFISKIELIGTKKLDAGSDAQNNLGGDSVRGSYVKVTVKPNTTLDEERVEFTVTFKAKKDDAMVVGSKNGDKYIADFKLWLSNPEADTDMETGKQGVYKPEAGDENTLTWSDNNNDVAEVEFQADSDPDDFVVKLSTKSVADIYTEYGDPVNADLYFRYFTGNPVVPSTNRPTLTLFNPYADDDDSVDPKDCFIYEFKDNQLIDMTSSFKWDDDKEGWSCKTRTLGNYIISDKELELEDEKVEDVVPTTPIETPVITEETDKKVPNTGRWA